MNVKRVIPSGYCKGVVNAIKLAKKTKENNKDKNVYVLGMLVHNSFVSDELAKLGIITLDDTNKSKQELLDEIDMGIEIKLYKNSGNEYSLDEWTNENLKLLITWTKPIPDENKYFYYTFISFVLHRVKLIIYFLNV